MSPVSVFPEPTIQELVERIERIEAGIGPKAGLAWKALPLGANWENFNAASFCPAEYAQDVMGFVHLRGLIKSKAIVKLSAYTVASNLLFQLPEGFRHLTTGQMNMGWGEGATSSLGPFRIDVFSDGTVYVLQHTSAVTEEVVNYLSLQSIVPFKAEH